MKIRILSDIHLEFGDYTVLPMDEDKDSVLILAGDVTVASDPTLMRDVFVPFMQRVSAQFEFVVYVLGNHEFYNGNIMEAREIIQKSLDYANIYNVKILEKETWVHKDVAFIGATLWTDNGMDSLHAPRLWHNMNDSRIIRRGEHRLSTFMVAEDHREAKKYILDEVKYWRKTGFKTVVVTHHGISARTTAPEYKDSNLTMFFTSELDTEFEIANPDLVISGHTHIAYDFMLNHPRTKTRVVANPLGYHGYECKPEYRGFKPTLQIEI